MKILVQGLRWFSQGGMILWTTCFSTVQFLVVIYFPSFSLVFLLPFLGGASFLFEVVGVAS